MGKHIQLCLFHPSFFSSRLQVHVLGVGCLTSLGLSPLLQGRAFDPQQPVPDAGAAGAAPRREEHAHNPRAHTQRLQQQPLTVRDLCFKGHVQLGKHKNESKWC